MVPENYPFFLTMEVKWGEMDALGHVNNTVYFRYAEEARIAYFSDLGFNKIELSSNIGPILAHIACDFLQPVLYPDTLFIGTWVEKIGNTSMQLDHEMVSKATQKIVAKCSSVIVLINYISGEKCMIDQEMKKRIATRQKHKNFGYKG